LKVGGYLTGLAIFPLLIFLGSLWSRVRAAGDEARPLATMLVGGAVVAVGLASVGTVITTSTAIRIGEIGPRLAKLLYELAGTSTDMTAFAVAVFVGATSAAALRARAFPAWLGWSGAVLTVAWLVAGLGVTTDNDAIGAFGFIVFLLWAGLGARDQLLPVPTAGTGDAGGPADGIVNGVAGGRRASRGRGTPRGARLRRV
jgi:hypothetical protein